MAQAREPEGWPRQSHGASNAASWSVLVRANVDENAVAMAEPMLAQGAGAMEELLQGSALRARSHRLGRKPRIVGDDARDVGLARLHAFDPEADMIHAAGDDAGAGIIGDVPGHDDQRHMAVAEIIIGIALSAVHRCELEHARVELG